MDTSIDERATAFRLLHERPDGFIIPNPLMAGVPREEARARVGPDIDRVLAAWQGA